MSHIARRVEGEAPYMGDLNSILSRPSLEGVCALNIEAKLRWVGGKLCVHHCSLELDNIE